MKAETARMWRSSRMLVAELVVVFLGVYGAFWVDNYSDEQERKARTEQVMIVLQQDLRDAIEVSGVFVSHMVEGLQEWSDARDRGELPAPFVFRIYGAERPPLTTWEVVRQAQLPELLRANLLYELGFYYNELDGWGERYVRYAEFTESEVLPLMKLDSSVFYTEDGSRLVPRFEAHMDRLRELTRISEDTVIWAACLLSRLESAEISSEPCRTDVGVTVL